VTSGNQFDFVQPGNVGGVGTNIPAAPAASPTAGSLLGIGPWTQLLKFVGQVRAEDGTLCAPPSAVTVAVSVLLQQSGEVNARGPFVGRVVWTSGNGAPNTAFFDIPPGVFPDPSVLQQSGALFTVNADTVEVSAMNLGNYIPPGGNTVLGSDVPGKGWANISEGPRGGAIPLTLTQWAAFGVGAFVAPATARVIVPPFAKSFRIFRASGAQAVVFQQSAPGFAAVDGPYTIAAGVPSGTYPLVGNAQYIDITAPAVALTACGVIFDIML